ncbi:MAG: hypothetical protein IPK83_20145 [Planctomycetes bacterium]|nr:hypothetical protein [Planctomycetota bacterium]
MKRKGRSRCIAKWTAFCASALILAVWGVSAFREVRIRKLNPAIICDDGCIFVTSGFVPWGNEYKDGGLEYVGHFERTFGFDELPAIWGGDTGGWYCLVLPYWSLLALTGMLTAMLFYFDRRKFLLGQCVACGYDLRSITCDRCPECGTSTVATGET